MTMKKLETPYSVTAGSFAPGEILTRITTKHKIESGQPQTIQIPFDCVVGEHLNFADPSKRFSKLITRENSELAICVCPDENNVHILAVFDLADPSGEKVDGSLKLIQIPISSLISCVRIDSQTALNLMPSRLRKAGAVASLLAAGSLLTDTLPMVAEVSIIVGVTASVLAQRRVQFLASDGEHVLLGSIPEIGWFLLDALLHEETWNGKKGE